MLPKDEVKIPRISGHCKGQIAFTSYGLQDSLQTLSFIFTMCLKWSRHTFKDEEVEVLWSYLIYPKSYIWYLAGPALDTRFCDSQWPMFSGYENFIFAEVNSLKFEKKMKLTDFFFKENVIPISFYLSVI